MRNYKERFNDILQRRDAHRKQRKVQYLTAFSTVTCGVLIVALLLPLLPSRQAAPPPIEPSQQAQEYQAVLSYVQKGVEAHRQFSDGMGEDMTAQPETGTNEMTSAVQDTYSETNLQVAGVDEADIIKTDGAFIYALSDNKLSIISASQGKLTLVSQLEHNTRTEEEQSTAQELYVSGNRLVVLRQVCRNNSTEIGCLMMDTADANSRYMAEIYDITERTAPRLVASYGQSGFAVTTRLVDNTLYLLSNYSVGEDIDGANPETYIPRSFGINDTVLPPEEIDLTAAKDCPVTCLNRYLLLSGIDISGDTRLVSRKAVLGYGGTVYANRNHVYVASLLDQEYASRTRILCFALENGNIASPIQGVVNGHLLNQFSMDEYNGYLRVVTTQDKYEQTTQNGTTSVNYLGQSNALYILDSQMKQVGAIENVAPDEQVYSVRFNGDIGYFVTFRQIDPLFAVDLSNPTAPAIVSALKITGFSQYLHPYGEGLLFGFGKEADTDGRAQDLKLSMFDVRDPVNVTEKHKKVLQGYDYSMAQYEHKAFLIATDKELIAFPAANRYIVCRYSPYSGFTVKAELELENANPVSIRGLYIGDYLYVFSGKAMHSYALDTFREVETLTLELII